MAVLVSEETCRLVAPFFNCVDLGKLDAGDQGKAIHIYQVIDAKKGPKQARGLAGLVSPMVGRDGELAALLQLTGTVAARLGRVALIMGESGLGKTRLIAEWKTAVSPITYQPPRTV